MKRILLVEAHTGGHLLVYLRIFVLHCREVGIRPVVALPHHAEGTTEFRNHLADIRDVFDLVPLAGRVSPAAVRGLALMHGCDRVVIPDADPYLTSFSTRRYHGPPISLLVMRDPAWEPTPTLARSLKMAIKVAVINLLKSRRAISVYFLRPPGYQHPTELFVNDPILATPDPEGSRALRRALGMSEDRFWFGIAGVITPRKNPALVMEALAALPPQTVGLLLAGEVQTAAREQTEQGVTQLQRLGIPVATIERAMSNDELNRAVEAMDCVVVAYSTHAPPSTLGKSIVLGTRCLLAGSPQLRAQAAGLRGIEECDLDEPSISEAMRRLAQTKTGPIYEQAPPTDCFASRLIGG